MIDSKDIPSGDSGATPLTPAQIVVIASVLHTARYGSDALSSRAALFHEGLPWTDLIAERRRTVINEVESYLANPDPSPADSPRRVVQALRQHHPLVLRRARRGGETTMIPDSASLEVKAHAVRRKRPDTIDVGGARLIIWPDGATLHIWSCANGEPNDAVQTLTDGEATIHYEIARLRRMAEAVAALRNHLVQMDGPEKQR